MQFAPNNRYLVPDLSPDARKPLIKVVPKFVFVAESPHVHEIEPDSLDKRRPLCGAAGKKWWGLLSEILEGENNTDVSLDRMLYLCAKYKFAVLNAVQYPLDPKISRLFPEADPDSQLGFSKVSGPSSFKKLKASPQVIKAIQLLATRLQHPSLSQAQIHCLGNDSEWFVTQALTQSNQTGRLGEKIPHPSAWWRRNGLFGKIAQEKLSHIFKNSL